MKTTIILRNIILRIVICCVWVGCAVDHPAESDHVRNGLNAAVTGDFINAEYELNRALQITPHHYLAKRYLKIVKDVQSQKITKESAKCLFKVAKSLGKHKFDEKLSLINKSISLNPEYAPAYACRGSLYCFNDMVEKAISDYKHAIALDSSDSFLYTNLGDIYRIEAKNYNEALSNYTKAIKFDTKNYFAYARRAAIYQEKKFYDLTLFDSEIAIKINPKYTHAYYVKALALEKINRPEEAIEAYNKYIEYATELYDVGNAWGEIGRANYAKRRIALLEKQIKDKSK